MRYDVAALFVDPRGPYPELVAEWFDERRDARTYAGPHPVVAHPPCGPWGVMKHLCTGQDALLGPVGVHMVRTWGGVLEHPRGSRLFRHCGLPHPGELPDCFGGIAFEVQQVDWGHVARKRTWLYVVGAPLGIYPPRPPKGEPTHWIGCSRRSTSRQGSPVPPGIKVCSPRQARRTPPDFARWLLALAAECRTS